MFPFTERKIWILFTISFIGANPARGAAGGILMSPSELL